MKIEYNLSLDELEFLVNRTYELKKKGYDATIESVFNMVVDLGFEEMGA